MSRIVLSDLSFHYDQPYEPVFEHLTLAIDTSWRTAVIGRNGMGKSTLLALIRGDLAPTGGSVHHDLALTSFPFEPPPRVTRTGDVVLDGVAPFRRWEREMEVLSTRDDAESIARFGTILEEYQRLGGYQIEGRIEREFEAMALDSSLLERDFATLSGGERTRALIVSLFLREGTFPLIDEPTNHLDLDGRERLGAYLASKSGFVVVSHDRTFLDSAADHVVAINRSDIRLHQTNYSGWRRQMDLTELHEKRRFDNLTRQVRTLEEAARQRRTWSHAKEKQKRGAYDKGRIGHLAARHMKRALHAERRAAEDLEDKKALLQNAEKERRLRLRSEGGGPETLVRATGLTVTLGGRHVLDGVDVNVRQGERVAVIGPNGSGKTTLLRALAGEVPLAEGVVSVSRHVRVERAHQDPLWQSGYLRDRLREGGIDEIAFRRVMGSLGVTGEVFERPLHTFSLGERKKVDLCRSFVGSAHLYIWDEPMNDIDIFSREQIERAILRHEPTMLFVEHDRWFIDRVATSVLDLGAPRRSEVAR